RSYKEATSRPDWSHWRDAMIREVENMNAKSVFRPSTLPTGRRAIMLQWVYAFKYNPDGSVSSYK
ncbi:hypothetical protein GGG16DRAFT_37250, partial [Schizophyllum commune]